jgi:hypothetical protein
MIRMLLVLLQGHTLFLADRFFFLLSLRFGWSLGLCFMWPRFADAPSAFISCSSSFTTCLVFLACSFADSRGAAARRAVPMTPRVRDIIAERWQAAGEPQIGYVWPAAKASVGHIVPNSIYEPHRQAIKDSGVRPFVLYSLRHTFLTRLGASGVDAWTLARIAGRSSVAVSATMCTRRMFTAP